MCLSGALSRVNAGYQSEYGEFTCEYMEWTLNILNKYIFGHRKGMLYMSLANKILMKHSEYIC